MKNFLLLSLGTPVLMGLMLVGVFSINLDSVPAGTPLPWDFILTFVGITFFAATCTAIADWVEDSPRRERARAARCICMSAHPDDPTPCPACCTLWERVRFTVENHYMRMVHGRTCVCGEH